MPTFGPFTRTAAQQISGVPVAHLPPVIAETGTPGTYEVTSPGLWTHGLTDPAVSYQWTRDGTPISGATSITYATVGADASTTLRCEVSVASTAAASNGVAIPAASAFEAVFRSHTAIRQEFVQVHTHTATIANIPGSTLVLVACGRGTLTDATMTVNGDSAAPLTAWLAHSNFSWLKAFEISAPSAESVSVAVTSIGNHHDHTHVVVFQVQNGTIVVADTEVNNNNATYDVTGDVLAGDRLLFVAHQRDGTASAHGVSGATILSQIIGRTDAGSTVSGPCVVAEHTATATASPYTITRTVNNGIEPNSAVLLRARTI